MTQKKLTPKQEMFCREYCIDFNRTQAAIRAGYSEKTAYSIGHELLKKPEIRNKINEYKQEIVRKYELSEAAVLQELQQIAHADMGEFVKYHKATIDEETGEVLEDATFEINDTRIVNTRAIEEISTSEKGTKVKLHNKVQALTKIGEYLGMWKIKNVNLNHNTKNVKDMTIDEYIDSLSDEDIETKNDEEIRFEYEQLKQITN